MRRQISMPTTPGIIQSRIASAGAGPVVSRSQAASPSVADTTSIPQRSSARERIAVATESSSAMTARMPSADASRMPAQKCAVAARAVALRTLFVCGPRASVCGSVTKLLPRSARLGWWSRGRCGGSGYFGFVSEGRRLKSVRVIRRISSRETGLCHTCADRARRSLIVESSSVRSPVISATAMF